MEPFPWRVSVRTLSFYLQKETEPISERSNKFLLFNHKSENGQRKFSHNDQNFVWKFKLCNRHAMRLIPNRHFFLNYAELLEVNCQPTDKKVQTFKRSLYNAHKKYR
jgi:hypothetical protein